MATQRARAADRRYPVALLWRRFRTVLIGVVSALVLASFVVAPAVSASPIGDAEAAMMAAWDKAGGAKSILGERNGDVYPAGNGFQLKFAGGAMFYTPGTGATMLYGPILDKYEALGGPVASDLGFPTTDEGSGLAGSDTRVAVFSASDKPVVYWTPQHGAFVVRGAMNAAWDRLGSSGGVLGVPIEDESHNGFVTTQKFSGGQLSWDRQTKRFTTLPTVLADQLTNVPIVIDPAAAINAAWSMAGGPGGTLGAKQGPLTVITNGFEQAFTGGKIFYNEASGAGALDADILSRYEALGGPSGDLGFPLGNEADGGFASISRMAEFSAADKSVIFWTPEHGAIVVRGAMRAAWDKLRGGSGALGAPIAEQKSDDSTVSQRFTGGAVTWDRAGNSFNTEPPNLASLLAGVQVPGESRPSSAVAQRSSATFTWHLWWLVAAIPPLILLGLLGLLGYRRLARSRSTAPNESLDYDADFDVAGRHSSITRPITRDQLVDYGDASASQVPDYGDAPAGRIVDYVDAPADQLRDHADQLADDYRSTRDEWSRDGKPRHARAFDSATEDLFDTTPIEVSSLAPRRGRSAGHAADRADDTDVFSELALVEDLEMVIPHTGGTDSELDAILIDDDDMPPTARHAGRHSMADSGIAAPGMAHSGVAAPGMADSGVFDGYQGPVPTFDQPAGGRHASLGRPVLHLPLEDPDLAPDGFPIKASVSSGCYYAAGTAAYYDAIADIWFTSADVAEANGFVRAE